MMNPADTAISELSEPVGEMTHEDYYKAATKSLPGAGSGVTRCRMMFASLFIKAMVRDCRTFVGVGT